MPSPKYATPYFYICLIKADKNKTRQNKQILPGILG
jgi:hypothetical protein